MSRVRAFLASSLDGFIAGEGDDLSWLPHPTPDEGDFGFGAFLSEIGALLMGRRSYGVVASFGGEWPHGDRTVLAATHRPLSASVPSVRALGGDAAALVAEARRAAAGKDVYVKGGKLLRQVLDAGLLDELTLTLVPVVLGRGRPLGAGLERRHGFSLGHVAQLPRGMVQLTYRRA
ncbi:MAG: dihydrofolate reductase [Deltaproteobacteria bacterium]|nr:dihydrofolate reductase [Deltaproteobacteria bacterium]